MNNLSHKSLLRAFLTFSIILLLKVGFAQPTNDDPCNALSVIPATSCNYQMYTTAGATASTSVPNPSCGGYAGGDVWYQTTVPPEGALTITTLDGAGDITDGAMELYIGSCNSLTPLQCYDYGNLGTMPSATVSNLQPGSTVWIRFWDYNNTISGTFYMCITTPSPPQGCEDASPFCTGTIYTFPAATNVPDAGPLACLGSSPNPAWYYLNIANSGDIALDISMEDANGIGQDVDFICYGPYNSLAESCTNQNGECNGPNSNSLSGNYGCSDKVVDCSYSGSATETCGIENAIAGEWYMLLLTNFSQVEADITFSQGNVGAPGSGTTNCNILCSMDLITATPSICNNSDDTYTVSGTIKYTRPPSSGRILITNTCSGNSQYIDGPFLDSISTYTLTGFPSNGADCSITAMFTESPTCTLSATLTAPPSCDTVCAFESIVATPSVCEESTNNHSANGSINFRNPPSSGSLTVSNSCGGSQTFNAPFTSPINYTMSDIPSNGNLCAIDAMFTAETVCASTQNYTSPEACTLCPVTASNNGELCEGSTLNLTATFIQDATYNWTGPNGFTSTLQNPTITNTDISMTGSYVVDVNIPSPPCNSSASTLVEIKQPPITTVNSKTICENTSTTLTATGADTYVWSTSPDLNTNIGANVTTTPSTNNSYTVTGTNVCSSSTAVANVTINPLPTVNVNDVTMCEGTSTNLIAIATFTDTYMWAPTTNLNPTTGNTVSASPITSTYYTVTATNNCGSRSSISNITVNPLPVLTVNSPTICPAETATLTASGADSYLWTPAASLNQTTGDIVNATPTNTTTYTITGTNNCGNRSTTATVSIIVPSVVTVNPDLATICVGDSTILTATGANTYSWTPSTNLSSTTGSTVFASPETPTTYSVIGTDGCGSNIAEADIHILSAPIANISDATSGCETIEATFNGSNGLPPYTFSYQIDSDLQTELKSTDSTSQVQVFNNSVDGGKTYSLTLISITDSNNCTTMIPDESELINVFKRPKAEFSVNPDQTNLLDPVITVNNTSVGGRSWDWDFNDGSTSTLYNPSSHSYTDTGVYNITLIVTDQPGCFDATSQTVIINPLFTIYIPNAFTPFDNNDLNNTFTPKGEGILSYSMDIYDRWGNSIYYTEDINKGWDGYIHGNKTSAQIDTYIYVINVKAINNSNHHNYTYRGKFNLIK